MNRHPEIRRPEIHLPVDPPSVEERTVLHTVSDLLTAVEDLPPAERVAARARIDEALQGDARSCRAALGMLALDLAPAAIRPTRDDLELKVHVIDLVPARASA